MSNAIFLQAELRLAAQGKAGSVDNGDKAITGIAYSGDVVERWGERLVIDLSTLDSGTPLQKMLIHQHKAGYPEQCGRNEVVSRPVRSDQTSVST